MFESFWAEDFASWRSRNDTGDMIFLCELGPPEYAMTGPDGREMSNRWTEALTLKATAERIWNDLGGDA